MKHLLPMSYDSFTLSSMTTNGHSEASIKLGKTQSLYMAEECYALLLNSNDPLSFLHIGDFRC